jgi:hypothetical protein
VVRHEMPPKSQSTGNLADLVAKVPALRDYAVKSSTQIATLWSNYGSIVRINLQSKSGEDHSVVVKSVEPPWSDPKSVDEGHLRKLLSYEVERWFYYNLAPRLPSTAKVATVYSPEDDAISRSPIRLLMEDLSVSYPIPARGSLNLDDTKSILFWLATFHGSFWQLHRESDIATRLIPPPLQYDGGNKQGVWEQGTYWYLDTRLSEFGDIDSGETWLLDWVKKVGLSLSTDLGMKLTFISHNRLIKLSRKKPKYMEHFYMVM